MVAPTRQNTDPFHLSGARWVAIYTDGRRGEYFDSFGWQSLSTFKDYMNTYCKHWTFNDHHEASPS